MKLTFKMDITREDCDDPYHGVTFFFILSLHIQNKLFQQELRLN